jgi:hypothetical protein
MNIFLGVSTKCLHPHYVHSAVLASWTVKCEASGTMKDDECDPSRCTRFNPLTRVHNNAYSMRESSILGHLNLTQTMIDIRYSSFNWNNFSTLCLIGIKFGISVCACHHVVQDYYKGNRQFQHFIKPKLFKISTLTMHGFVEKLWKFCHCSLWWHKQRDVRNYLDANLPQRWIGCTTWDNLSLTCCQPRSPDLTPCDFCLWGYVKDKVFIPPVPVT